MLKGKANMITSSFYLRLCSHARKIKRSNLTKIRLLVLIGFILARTCAPAYRVWLNHEENGIH